MRTWHLLLGAWIVLAPLGLTYLWLTRPDLGPRFPEAFGVWLMSATGVKTPEGAAEIETLFLYCLCLIAVSLATWAVLRLLRRQ